MINNYILICIAWLILGATVNVDMTGDLQKDWFKLLPLVPIILLAAKLRDIYEYIDNKLTINL